MADDLLALAELPEAALSHLWEALGPALREPIAPDVEDMLTRFCERYEAPEDALARGLKAARFLLRAAAARDLEASRFAGDLGRLAGQGAKTIELVLLAGYEQAKLIVRREIRERTLAEHEGKVVEDLRFRVEQILCSSYGEAAGERMLALSFRYREGANKGEISLHLDRPAIEELLRACTRALQ